MAHCDPPRSRKEFDNICDWIVKNLRQKRDQLHESERLKRNQARRQRQQTSNEDKATEAIQEGIDENGINVAMQVMLMLQDSINSLELLLKMMIYRPWLIQNPVLLSPK